MRLHFVLRGATRAQPFYSLFFRLDELLSEHSDAELSAEGGFIGERACHEVVADHLL